MVDLVSFAVNAAAISSLYALVAVGFTLVFGVGGVLNFAHGAVLTAGAFGAYQVAELWGHSPWLGLLAGTLVGAALAVAVYLAVVRHALDRPVVAAILTLLAAFVVHHLLRAGYGAGPISLASPTPGLTSVAGVEVLTHSVFVFALSWVAVLGLVWFVESTATGRAIRARRESARGAALVGIDGDRVDLYVWAIGGALAGLAGVLLVGFRTGSWLATGIDALVLSFAIVVLGGLGSVRGSVVGAYVVGTVETASTTYVDPALTGVPSLVLLIVVLLVRPTGLFGREVET